MTEYCYLPLFLLAGLALVFLFSRVLSFFVSIPTRGERQESERANKQAAITAQKTYILQQIRQWKTGTAPSRLWDRYYALDAEERALLNPEAQASGRAAKVRR